MWKKLVASIIPLCFYGFAAAQTIIVPLPTLAGSYTSESADFSVPVSDPALNGLADIQSVHLRIQGTFVMGEALYLDLVYDPDIGNVLTEVPGPLGIGFSVCNLKSPRAIGFFFSDDNFDLTEAFDPYTVQGLGTSILYVHFSAEYLNPGSYLATLSEPQLNITLAELVIVTVPEPGTLGLLAVGGLLFKTVRRHRRILCKEKGKHFLSF